MGGSTSVPVSSYLRFLTASMKRDQSNQTAFRAHPEIFARFAKDVHEMPNGEEKSEDLKELGYIFSRLPKSTQKEILKAQRSSAGDHYAGQQSGIDTFSDFALPISGADSFSPGEDPGRMPGIIQASNAMQTSNVFKAIFQK